MSSFQFEQIGVIRSPYKEKFAVPLQPGLVKSANGELHLIAPYNQADAVRGLEAFSHFFQFEQIGVIRSPYKEKFAVPLQPGLVKSANGELHLIAPYNQADAVRGLEAFSHLWILFVFHQTMEGGWRPTVRPPRLGGNARMGVFATRSTFRPNPIGMSLVELKEVVCHKDSVILKLGSLDLVKIRRSAPARSGKKRQRRTASHCSLQPGRRRSRPGSIQPFLDPFSLSSNDGRRLASDCASASTWR